MKKVFVILVLLFVTCYCVNPEIEEFFKSIKEKGARKVVRNLREIMKETIEAYPPAFRRFVDEQGDWHALTEMAYLLELKKDFDDAFGKMGMMRKGKN
uniref:Uncharacterized protein n=1 Tax=Panagrolaimus sp. JU765 TaxID=591449 RepID=A0AC34RBU6_9BILA